MKGITIFISLTLTYIEALKPVYEIKEPENQSTKMFH